MTSLSVDHHGMAVVSSGVAVKSFKSAVLSSVLDHFNANTLWSDSEEAGSG